MTESIISTNKYYNALSSEKGTKEIIFKKLYSVLDITQEFQILSKVSNILNGEICDRHWIRPLYRPFFDIQSEVFYSIWFNHALDDRRD